jgi:pimeloyl-ACP methyl ester carboxylesterase
MSATTIWARVRRIWVRAGAITLVVFPGWMMISVRATSQARAALSSDAHVTVGRGSHYWSFEPAAVSARVGVLFFPGAGPDPVAYAPLLREVAASGYPSILVEVPRRGLFGGADDPELLDRARMAMRALRTIDRWVAAGHSRGGLIAATFVRREPSTFAGLVLIGTSHPRDFSLADAPFPVTQVYGTRDTVADVDKVLATRANLPAAARMVPIAGGNHAQFGYYGFQLGDWPATIARDEQQRQTLDALLDVLRAAARISDHPISHDTK